MAYMPNVPQRFRDAVWGASPEELTTGEALMLLAYADYARTDGRSWISTRQLMQLCKTTSMGTVIGWRQALVKKGWLTPDGPAPGRGRVAAFWLTVPGSAPPTGALNGRATVPTIGAPSRSSAPLTGAVAGAPPIGAPDDRSAHRSTSAPTTGAVDQTGCSDSDPEVLRLTGKSAPVTGTYSVNHPVDPEGQQVVDEPTPRELARAREAAARWAASHPRARSKAEDPQRKAATTAPAEAEPGEPARALRPPANGETWTKDEAMAYMRSILPKGKPMSRWPKGGPR